MRITDAVWKDNLLTRIEVIPESGCWIFLGHLNKDGYGKARFHGKVKYVHQITYKLFVGEIDEGLELDHLCRVRCCANPWHLEAVPHRINSGRMVKRPSHCKSGHLFSEENTYITTKGHRQCRTCNRDKQFSYYWRKHD